MEYKEIKFFPFLKDICSLNVNDRTLLQSKKFYEKLEEDFEEIKAYDCLCFKLRITLDDFYSEYAKDVVYRGLCTIKDFLHRKGFDLDYEKEFKQINKLKDCVEFQFLYTRKDSKYTFYADLEDIDYNDRFVYLNLLKELQELKKVKEGIGIRIVVRDLPEMSDKQYVMSEDLKILTTNLLLDLDLKNYDMNFFRVKKKCSYGDLLINFK